MYICNKKGHKIEREHGKSWKGIGKDGNNANKIFM